MWQVKTVSNKCMKTLEFSNDLNKGRFDVRESIDSVKFVAGWSCDRIWPLFWKKIIEPVTSVGSSLSN